MSVTKPGYKLEVIVGIAVGAEDVLVKGTLRVQSVDLPVSNELQNFYYNHTGDYMNGYIGALCTNFALTSGLEMLSQWSERHLDENNPLRQFAERANGRRTLLNIISGVVSSAVVVVEETYGYFGTPDLKDIPMGIAGAITHMLLQYCVSIRHFDTTTSQGSLSD